MQFRAFLERKRTENDENSKDPKSALSGDAVTAYSVTPSELDVKILGRKSVTTQNVC